jgi:hypothetical protein
VTRPAFAPAATYRRFWTGVGERFPDLEGAASTRYYADNERRLFTEHFPTLAGLRIRRLISTRLKNMQARPPRGARVCIDSAP